MSHPHVLCIEIGGLLHIMVDGGDESLCDLCCKNCDAEPHGFRFGSYVVCAQCAYQNIRDGEKPDEISRPGEGFKAFCDRLNEPLRQKMDRIFAETN